MKSIEQLDRMINRLLSEGDSKSLPKKIANKNKRTLKQYQEAKTYLEFGATEEGVAQQEIELQKRINVIIQRKEDSNLTTSESKGKFDRKYGLTQKRKQLKMLQFILSDAEAH